jgi:hypothetical protein
MCPFLGSIMGLTREIEESLDARRHYKDYIATFPTIPSIGTTMRNKLLASKGDTAIAPISGLHKYFRLINEHTSLS